MFQKFVVDGVAFADFDAPEVLVIKEKLSPDDLQKIIQDNYDAYQSYFDKNINVYTSMCDIYGITADNYEKGVGGIYRSNYESLVRCQKLKESYKPSVIFNIAGLGGQSETLKYLSDTLPQIQINGDEVNFCLQVLEDGLKFYETEKVPDIFTAEEFAEIKECEQYLTNEGVLDNLYIKEGVEGTALTLNQVELSNKFIKIIADEIRELDLTPFEIVNYIHDFCTKFFYNQDNPEYDTNLLGDIVSSGNIRCVGYATMFKAIIDELNISGLKAELACCYRVIGDGHATNIITIKDEKYGVFGEYMQDSCKSSILSSKTKPDLECCLFPIDDIMNIYNNGFRFVRDVSLQRYYGLGHEEYDKELSSKMKTAKYLDKAHKRFVDSYKNKGKPIAIEKYAAALFECYTKQGMSEQLASNAIAELIDYTIAITSIKANKNTSSPFYNSEISDEYLKQNLGQVEYIDFMLENINKEIETCEDLDRKEELISLRYDLENESRALIEKRKKLRDNNVEIISSVLEK